MGEKTTKTRLGEQDKTVGGRSAARSGTESYRRCAPPLVCGELIILVPRRSCSERLLSGLVTIKPQKKKKKKWKKL